MTVTGGKATLRWDVTKDAAITLTPGPVNLTPLSVAGVGSIEVTVATPQTYTLTISRGGEPVQQRSVSVGTIPGVAAGWTWLEDFDARTIGVLGGQPRWKGADGEINVIAAGPNQAATVTDGGDLTALNLRSLAVKRNTAATLFFRFFYSSDQAELPVGITLGLTEKTVRFNGDFATNAGTVLRLNRPTAGLLTLQARNGPLTNWTDAVYPFIPDRAYNVWLDIQNNPLGTADVYNVYVAPEGGARTLVFENYTSDREPGEVPLLGFPLEEINTLVIAADTTGQASRSIMLDDFYLSAANTRNAMVPVPSRFTDPFSSPFRVTSISRNPVSTEISLTWLSDPARVYSVWTSEDLSGWVLVDAAIPSQGTETTHTLSTTFSPGRRFFQVRR